MDLQTIDTYNELANEYDLETIDFWKKFPSTIFDRFMKSIVGKKILDVGSGPGRDGKILQENGFDVTCLDASEAMVKISSDRGLKTVLGDFNYLPFEDQSFDGVWAYTSLLHISKSEINKPINEISRVLKKGGIFCLGMIEGEGEIYRESSGMKKPRLFSFYKKEELENLLSKHGFGILYFEEFKPGSKKYLNFVCKKMLQ